MILKIFVLLDFFGEVEEPSELSGNFPGEEVFDVERLCMQQSLYPSKHKTVGQETGIEWIKEEGIVRDTVSFLEEE